ncbi:MAG TPA: alpha/beta hydrolase [Candidatus Paceibacterota bacterium]|nr:alpha/beta hydrolase [Candidatus Paceibacterota bacterium]
MTFKNREDYLHYLKTREIALDKKRWAQGYLDKKLGKDFEIIRPRMPLSENSKYEEWKIHFERFFPFLRDDLILIGNSLGSIFLAKYLSENKMPIEISGIFLVCAPFDNTLEGEDLVGGFKLKADLSPLERYTENLYFMFSEDDNVVPVSHAEKYRKKLPKAHFIIYKSKNGHFDIAEFPEIVKMIKGLTKKRR